MTPLSVRSEVILTGNGRDFVCCRVTPRLLSNVHIVIEIDACRQEAVEWPPINTYKTLHHFMTTFASYDI